MTASSAEDGQGPDRERAHALDRWWDGEEAKSRLEQLVELAQMLHDRMPAPSSAVWIGRSPERVLSMFTESMPTIDAGRRFITVRTDIVDNADKLLITTTQVQAVLA